MMREMMLNAKPRKVPTLSEFMEKEIVLPNGPYEGQRYRTRYQPHARHFLDEIDTGKWPRISMTGTVQGGKTMIGSACPCLYHLFGIGETVVYGLPNMDMANDKWNEDLLPILERTRFRELIPRKGAGSRGGKAISLKFRNGKTLRFMTAGGDDKQRSAFTTRVVIITEADGMDKAGGASEETDKVRQIENRAGAYGDNARIYLECTVSVELGRIWQEHLNGTGSVVACQCVHCKSYVTPEREHLVGWQDAIDELEAKENTRFCCPSCGGIIDEDQRRTMNVNSVLVHRGQEVTLDGVVTGDMPRTLTFSYRFSAFNNMFVSAGSIGVKEWRAMKADDNENLEREITQYIWVKPFKPRRRRTSATSTGKFF